MSHVRISGATEAEACIREIGTVATRLAATLAAETELVRRAKLREAAALAPEKLAEISNYLVGLERLKANAVEVRRHAPRALSAFLERHAAFQSVVEANLIVLGTARTVSENLVRGIAEEVSRATRPTTYGAGGTASAYRNADRPIAVSRSL
jgi:hypothetical protein